MTGELATFEQAFKRLEEILDRMNADGVELEESLRLFEEANGLLSVCQQRLADAERRVELIVKNRQGGAQLDTAGRPVMTSVDI